MSMRVSDVHARKEQPDPPNVEIRSKHRSQALGDTHHFTSYFSREVIVVREVLSRNNQDMTSSYRTDIQKGDYVLGLVDKARRHLLIYDTTEKALGVVHAG